MLVNSLDAAVNVFNRYETKYDVIKDYYGLLAYYALAQVAEAKKDEELLKKCRDYLSLYPDEFNHPRYNFEAYRVGGNPKAWLFFKGFIPSAEKELREYAELTLGALKSEEGITSNPKDNHKIWIDTVFCITPFMLYVGLALKEQKYIDYAADICFKSYDVFMDGTNGLLHQCKGFLENQERLSADHWSRGNGWGYIPLAEMLQHLPEDSCYREKAIKYYMDHTDALLKYQTEKGLWRQEIPEELSWYESSGTGLILYGIGVGIRCGILKDERYMTAFKKGIEGIGKYCLTKEFMTKLSCPGCLCPGFGDDKGSVKAYITEKLPQNDEVHSYGCIMLALVEAYKNGITQLEIAD